jgi:dihydroorotase
MEGRSGVPHLDTYGAFATWLMAEHGFSAKDIARVCAYNPGCFVKEFLPAGFGKDLA